MAVHPSSIVDPRAKLADDVSVGPWCLIEGEVTIGPGTRLLERVSLKGPLAIGARNVIYPQACIGLEPQHRKFLDPAFTGAGVVIGDDNLLREGVTINRATGPAPTRLGHRNMLMVNTHLGHDAAVGDDCTLANNAVLGGHAELADRVTLGGGAGVHQFVRIGRLSMLGGLVGVTQDVPPFCTCYAMRSVGSLNLVGLRRSGYRAHIDALREAFDLFFRRGHTNRVAVKLIEDRLGSDALCAEFTAFIGSSKRGVTGYGRPAKVGEEVG